MFRIFILFYLLFNYSLALSLEESYFTALKNSNDLKINKNSLYQINEDINIADAQNYPTVDFYGFAKTKKTTLNKDFPDNNQAHTKEDEYKVEVVQNLYSGGQTTYDKKVNKKRLDSAKQFLEENKNKFALEVSESYINVLKQRDSLTLYKEAYIKNQTFFSKVKKKLINGYGTKLEYEKSREKLEESKVNLAVQKLNYKNALENFGYILQEDFDSNELIKPVFTYALPKSLNKAISKAKELNPSLKVAKENVEVSRYQQKRDESNFKPKVNLLSSYQIDNSLHSTRDKYNEYEVGLELNYNIYNGGKDSSTNKKNLLIIKEKKETLEKIDKQITNRVKLAWNEYKSNEKKFEKVKKYVYTKKQVLQAALKEFDLGFKNLDYLLDENIEYINIKRNLINTSYDLLLSKYKLLEAIGILSSSFELNKKRLNDEESLIKSILNNQPEPTKEKPKPLKDDEFSIDNENIEDILKIDIHKKEDNFETFKEKFLNASKKNYTIDLATVRTQKQAQSIINEYNLSNESFFFTIGKNRDYQKLVLGVYENKSLAYKKLNSLDKNLLKNGPFVQKIHRKQNLYYKYHSKQKTQKKKEAIFNSPTLKIKQKKVDKLEQSIIAIKKKPKTVKRKKTVQYKTFKDKFLLAPKNNYTINLATSTSKTRANRLIKRYKLKDKAFTFTFGEKKKYEKIVLGVFKNKQEAKKELLSLNKQLKKNKPYVERIERKQALYNRFNGKNL